MIHAIIFDMDGVLIDSQPMHYEGDRLTLAAHGIDVPVEDMIAYAGTTNVHRFTIFKEKYHLTESIEVLIEERERIMIDLVTASNAEPTAGAVDLLQSIKAAGLKTAVASSSSYPFIHAVLRKLGVEQYFDLIFSGESVPKGKPAPDVFLETCQRLEEQPDHCVVIEDSSNGVLAAVRAGMACVGYQNPTSGEQDLSKATVIIDDFRTIDAMFLLNI
ncbi:MAG: HAD family hydrolase [Coprococcus sp.]